MPKQWIVQQAGKTMALHRTNSDLRRPQSCRLDQSTWEESAASFDFLLESVGKLDFFSAGKIVDVGGGCWVFQW